MSDNDKIRIDNVYFNKTDIQCIEIKSNKIIIHLKSSGSKIGIQQNIYGRSQVNETHEIEDIDTNNLPTIKDIKEYIERKQPLMEHTNLEITKHFIGFQIKASEHKNIYNILWRRMKKAREKIEKQIQKKYPKMKFESERLSRDEIRYYLETADSTIVAGD